MIPQEFVREVNLLNNAALAYFNKHEYREAEVAFRNVRAFALKPEHARLWELVSPIQQSLSEGYRGICLFYMAKYAEATTCLKSACHAYGLTRDDHYFRFALTHALATRGLGNSEDANAALRSLRTEALHHRADALIEQIDNEIQNTDLIKANRPLFRLKNGCIGGALFGCVDVTIPPSALGVACSQLLLSVELLDSCSFRIDLEFSLNNPELISGWEDADDSLNTVPDSILSRTPMLFALLLPRGAHVPTGSYQLDLNDPDPRWREQYFTAHNHFYNIFHPESYPHLGYRPVPSTKHYKYVQSQCALFRARLPAMAHVRFAGVIDYMEPTLTAGRFLHSLTAYLLLPFSPVHVSSVHAELNAERDPSLRACSLHVTPVDFAEEQQDTALTERYQTFFDVRVWPPLSPHVGHIPPNAPSAAPITLRNLQLLSLKLELPEPKGVRVAVRHSRTAIPVGIHKELTYPEIKNDDGVSFSLNARKKHVPLFQVATMNESRHDRTLSVDLFSSALGISSSHKCQLAPGAFVVTECDPVLPTPPPLFKEAAWCHDDDLHTRMADLSLCVTEEASPGALPIYAHTMQIPSLPPDYIVWAISNQKTGSYADLRHVIAKWVTPGATSVRQCLDRAGIGRAGYGVCRDMKRVYQALLGYELVYDMSRICFDYTMEHHVQRVRLPSVVLANKRMNCIDGSVLLASCLEALGYDPIILFVPFHALVGVIAKGTPKAIEELLVVESTGLCDMWVPDKEGAPKCAAAGQVGVRLGFECACAVGREQFADNFQHVLSRPAQEPVKMGPDGMPVVSLVHARTIVGVDPCHAVIVSAARAEGVVPHEGLFIM